MKSKIILSLFVVFIALTAVAQKKDKKNSPSSEKGLVKITVMYPFSEGKTFNMEYYESKHMPMVAGYLGANLVRYTIEKGVANGMPNQPVPYMAVGAFYVKNLADYQAAIAPNIEAIRADFANYTNALPVILVSDVVR